MLLPSRKVQNLNVWNLIHKSTWILNLKSQTLSPEQKQTRSSNPEPYISPKSTHWNNAWHVFNNLNLNPKPSLPKASNINLFKCFKIIRNTFTSESLDSHIFPDMYISPKPGLHKLKWRLRDPASHMHLFLLLILCARVGFDIVQTRRSRPLNHAVANALAP